MLYALSYFAVPIALLTFVHYVLLHEFFPSALKVTESSLLGLRKKLQSNPEATDGCPLEKWQRWCKTSQLSLQEWSVQALLSSTVRVTGLVSLKLPTQGTWKKQVTSHLPQLFPQEAFDCHMKGSYSTYLLFFFHIVAAKTVKCLFRTGLNSVRLLM